MKLIFYIDRCLQENVMAIEWDPIIFINLVLCIIIVVLGILLFRKSGEKLPLYVGIAFGLFGISHAATLAGFKIPLTLPLIVIRTAAYLLVIYALYTYLKASLMQKEARQAWVDFFREESCPAVIDTNEQEE
jgi:CHASE2 domain-containing sensor protein